MTQTRIHQPFIKALIQDRLPPTKSSGDLDLESMMNAPVSTDSDEEIESSLPDADYENILDYVPFAQIRPTQQYALDEIRKALLDDKIKYIIVEAPTGSGKSGMAIAAALSAQSAYISTANRNLQDQYLRDFEGKIQDLRGRANYKCYKTEGENCATAPCKQDRKKLCTRACEYHEVLGAAKEASVASVNVAAYLAFTNFANFGKRNLNVFDEGHSLPHWLTNFIEITFSADQFSKYGIRGFEIPDYEDIAYYAKFLENILSYLKDNRENFSKSVAYDAEDYSRFTARLAKFLHQINENDISNFVLSKDKDISGKIRSLSFKPVAVDQYAQDYLFKHANKNLILSATILDFQTFATGLGMKPENTRCIRVPSTFPVDRRPIYTHMAEVSLSQKNLMQELPNIVKKIKQIMDHYPDQKGIIHGTSYMICKYIRDHLRDNRILFPESSSQQKEILQQHEDSTDTVLLSPSMTEGVDLKDDASRFQIIVKCPFPYLGDPVVKKRMDLYPNYYGLQTVLVLVQAYGRSIRTETDWAHTYVLDRQFFRVINEQKSWLPPWFTEAIQ